MVDFAPIERLRRRVSHLEQRRSPDELPDLVVRLEPQIAAVFSRFHVARQDAEDILQDVLLQYILRCQTIVSPESWLMGTLRNSCLLYWRRRRRALLEAVDSGLLVALAGTERAKQENDDLSRDLSRAVGRLPERCRSLLKLRYRLGCNDPEVADQLGYSPTGIRKITQRCLLALTSQMLQSGFSAATT
jgi:RNA polymerase sigma-70 factor (ECF subfamily)